MAFLGSLAIFVFEQDPPTHSLTTLIDVIHTFDPLRGAISRHHNERNQKLVIRLDCKRKNLICAVFNREGVGRKTKMFEENENV